MTDSTAWEVECTVVSRACLYHATFKGHGWRSRPAERTITGLKAGAAAHLQGPINVKAQEHDAEVFDLLLLRVSAHAYGVLQGHATKCLTA